MKKLKIYIWFVVMFLFSCSLSGQKMDSVYYPPQNLTGEFSNDTVYLSWNEPGNGNTWIHWDSTENYTSIGLITGGEFYAASRWLPEELAGYENYYLTKIAFFPTNDTNTSFTLLVWEGDEAATQLVSQEIVSYEINQWNEISLNNPVQINTSKELWFGFKVDQYEGFGVAGADHGPAIKEKGELISLDGITWNTLSNMGYNNNWNLQAFLSFTSDGKTIAQPTIKEKIPQREVTYTDIFAIENVWNESKIFKPLAKSTKALFQHYRLIHKLEGESWEILSTTTNTVFKHANISQSVHYYMVYAIYEEGESLPEGPFIIDLMGIEKNIAFKTRIYPNPATDVVYISSDYHISRIKIFNNVGQKIAEEVINSKKYHFNTSEYHQGLYTISIETENGILNTRVIIKK